MVITARDAERLGRGRRASWEREPRRSTRPTSTALERFFAELAAPIDHVLVTGPGPYYAPLAEFEFDAARRDVDSHLLLPIQIARNAVGRVRPGRHVAVHGRHRRAPHGGRAWHCIAALTAAMPALSRNLAIELAPIRVNLIAAGFVDTPLSATLLGDQLDARREQLRNTLPIAAWSGRPTSPRWPSTSWPTRR